MSLKPTLPSERKPPVRHEIPQPVAREAGADYVVTGTVKSLRDQLFQLWDCPEQRYYRATSEIMRAALEWALNNNYRCAVTIGADYQVKNVEILK